MRRDRDAAPAHGAAIENIAPVMSMPRRRPGRLAHLEVLDEQSGHDLHRGEGTASAGEACEDPARA